MMEVCLKVKENENGFIPTNIHLSSSTKERIFVHIDLSFEALSHVGYMVEKHGDIPSPTGDPLSVEAHSPTLPSNRTASLFFTENIDGTQFHWEEHSSKALFSHDPSTLSIHLPSTTSQPIALTFEKPKKPPHPQYIDGEKNLLLADFSNPSLVTSDLSHTLSPQPASPTSHSTSANNSSSLSFPHNLSTPFNPSTPPVKNPTPPHRRKTRSHRLHLLQPIKMIAYSSLWQSFLPFPITHLHPRPPLSLTPRHQLIFPLLASWHLPHPSPSKVFQNFPTPRHLCIIKLYMTRIFHKQQ